MTFHQLADELRNVFAEENRVSRKKMNMFTDQEVVNIFNTCGCCNNDILDKDELATVLSDVSSADEFFVAMDVVISNRGDAGHIADIEAEQQPNADGIGTMHIDPARLN